jgi:hypothetical protein
MAPTGPHFAAPKGPTQPQYRARTRAVTPGPALGGAPSRVTTRTQRVQQRALLRQERRDLQAQRLQTRLERRAQQGRLTRTQRRELQRLQAQQPARMRRAEERSRLLGTTAQRRELQTQPRGARTLQTQQTRRAMQQARIAPAMAAQSRFAGRFHHTPNSQWSRARHERWAPRHAWQRGVYAAFIPWYGAVYWPYVYADIFDYTFWPYAYDVGYWDYAYDDFFYGIFFPYGPPYIADAYVGPYERVTVGRRRVPVGTVTATARQLCEDPGQGITAWPFQAITDAVRPDDAQRALLDDLKSAAARAADAFKASCPTVVPMTPVGRLEAMIGRLQATLEAVRIVRPPLEKFYASLSDEQRARFNEVGPEIGRRQAAAARPETQGAAQANGQPACPDTKAGLADFPIDRIDEVVRPRGDQQDALDRLSQATQKAVETLQAACPTSVPLTPTGRLEAMENRLDAMLSAAKTILPALQDFYASLDNEQKARFNTLDRNTRG